MPFFQATSSFGRSLPFFYPSQQHLPFAIPRSTFFTRAVIPSPTFTALRTAFHTSTRPVSTRITPIQARGFRSSAAPRGIRPYFGNQQKGRRPPNWKDRINSIEHVWILGGLIGELRQRAAPLRSNSVSLTHPRIITRVYRLVVNVAVYCAWAYGQELAVRFRDASWVKFLQRNFTVSWQNITQGRV